MTNDTLTEMWAALERLQPIADRNDAGGAWQRMLNERTYTAAIAARRACGSNGLRVQGDADALALMSWAAADAADALMDNAASATRYAQKALQAVRS